MERMLTKKGVAVVNDPVFANYVARGMGTGDVGKIICPFDENLLSTLVSMLFKKGNPLLDRFNIVMRRFLEAGLLERLSAELQHGASLRGERRSIEANRSKFFAFTFSHLMPAFVVMFLGTVLSSVVFIAEIVVKRLCNRR